VAEIDSTRAGLIHSVDRWMATDGPHRHFPWQRLSELACAYGDLTLEVCAGRRALPTHASCGRLGL